MIYPSADKLNKVGSKYKLIAMAATRSKQIKAGMKPLIETTSTNPLTIAFEEIAAGLITANIENVDEVPLDYTELARASAIYENTQEENSAKSNDDDEVAKIGEQIDNDIIAPTIEGESKSQIAEEVKNKTIGISDIPETD